MSKPPVDKHLFVIFGGTGNLSLSKLLPALYNLLVKKNLKDVCQVLGVATKDIDDEGFREKAREALITAGFSKEEVGLWCDTCVHYQSLGKSSEDYPALGARIKSLEEAYEIKGNRVFYLALPPPAFPKAIKGKMWCFTLLYMLGIVDEIKIIDWYNFDWLPARKPYDINSPEVI